MATKPKPQPSLRAAIAVGPYLSVSERSAFKQCRWKWWVFYVMRLKPKYDAPALRFGSLIHKALELYYIPGRKRGVNPAITFEKEYERELKESYSIGFRDEDGKWGDAAELGLDMLNGYVEQYGSEGDLEVVASESRFEAPITHPDSGRVIGIAVGVVDGIWRWVSKRNKPVEIVDHKTATSIDVSYLSTDDQAGQYWTFGVDRLRENKVLKPAQPLDRITFNFLRKAKKDLRPQNALGQYLNQDGVTVSKKQPPENFVRHPSFRNEADRASVRASIASELQEMALVRSGVLAVYKSPSKENCRGCPVREACELHESGQDWRAMLKMTMVPKGSWRSVKDEAAEVMEEAVNFEHSR
jgi:hypothetical protein